MISPIFAFAAVCLIDGSSYAINSVAIRYMDEIVFNIIRTFSAFTFVLFVFWSRYCVCKSYRINIKGAIKGETFSILKCLFSGVLFLGVPSSLILLAQRSIPSTIVTLVQPTIPFFSLIAAHFFVKGEKLTVKKLLSQIIAIGGAILTIIPSLQPEQNQNVKFLPLSYLFLFVALALYGTGSVFIKLFLDEADVVLSSTISLLGSSLYSLGSSVIRHGIFDIYTRFSETYLTMKIAAAAIGIVYGGISSILFMYVVGRLGPVKANLASFGQIVVGMIIGGVFLGEWKGMSTIRCVLLVSGAVFIIIALLVDLIAAHKESLAKKYSESELVAVRKKDKFYREQSLISVILLFIVSLMLYITHNLSVNNIINRRNSIRKAIMEEAEMDSSDE